MENLTMHKVRLSVLWLFTDVAWLVGVVLSLMEPGAIEEVMSGVIEGMQVGPMLGIITIGSLVPLVMAFLSLTLKDSPNRWANIILGIVYTGLELFDLIWHLAQPSAHMILMGVSIVVAPALIAWYAWKWPKQSHRVRSKYSWRDDLM